MTRTLLALVSALSLLALASAAHAAPEGTVSFGFGGPVAPRVVERTTPTICSLGCCAPVVAQPAVHTTTYAAAPAPTTQRVVRRVVQTRPGWYDPPWSYRPVAGGCTDQTVVDVTTEVVERPAYRVRYVYGGGCHGGCGSGCYGGCGWPYGYGCASPCYGGCYRGCGWGCGWGYPVAWGLGLGLGLGLAGCW
jgi:hypothetical protein